MGLNMAKKLERYETIREIIAEIDDILCEKLEFTEKECEQFREIIEPFLDEKTGYPYDKQL